jgi:hypothetical protein
VGTQEPAPADLEREADGAVAMPALAHSGDGRFGTFAIGGNKEKARWVRGHEQPARGGEQVCVGVGVAREERFGVSGSGERFGAGTGPEPAIDDRRRCLPL